MRKQGALRRGRGVLAVTALGAVLGGCTELDNTLARVPFFSFMRESAAFDPYEAPRNAPPNTVPFESPGGEKLPPTPPNHAQMLEWGAQVTNPLPMSAEVIEAGQASYTRHCYVCHGPTGEGDGPVTVRGGGKFPFAPSLLTPNAQNLSDGYLYAIIRVGRGLMPPYGGRITHDERWSIVNYIRQLQQQAQGGAPQPAAATSGEE